MRVSNDEDLSEQTKLYITEFRTENGLALISG